MNPAVDRLQRQGAHDSRVIALGGALPSPELFPRAALATALEQALADPHAPALQYGWPEGSEGLRAFVAAHLRARGAAIHTDDVIITSGAQQAIAIAARLLLPAGARIAVGSESYPAAIDLFRSLRLRPVAAARTGALYVMPAVDNPRGRALGDEARRALLRTRLPLIEDDAYADLAFAGAPPPLLAEARARVFHVGTFSKTLCPGLRVGWLIPPRRRRAQALRLKRDLDLQASSLGQAVLEHYLGSGAIAVAGYAARLRDLRAHYQRRSAALLSAVRRHLPLFRVAAPAGGFSLWLQSRL